MNATDKKKPITLLSIDIVEVGLSEVQNQQSVHKSMSQYDYVEEGDDEDVSPISFIKNGSSSLSDGPQVSSEAFQLQEAASCLKISLSGVSVEIDGKDFI